MGSPVQRVLIIGLGNAGRRHVRLLRQLRPRLTFAALRRPDSAPTDLDIETMVAVDEALRWNPQLVVVAGPVSARVSSALPFAEAGASLLLEKPLALSVAEAEPLVAAVRRTGALATVGYNLRFLAVLRRVKDTLEMGSLGRPLSARVEVGQHLRLWHPEQPLDQALTAQRSLGGGALLELSHEIDYSAWLFGPLQSVRADLDRLAEVTVDAEDHVELSATAASGVVLTIHLDLLRRPPTRTVTVLCEQGVLHADLLVQSLSVSDGEGAASTEVLEEQVSDTYLAQLEAFLRSIEQGHAAAVTLDDGLAALSVIDAARESHASGERVTLPGAGVVAS